MTWLIHVKKIQIFVGILVGVLTSKRGHGALQSPVSGAQDTTDLEDRQYSLYSIMYKLYKTRV